VVTVQVPLPPPRCSPALEDVDAGLIHSEHGVYTEYIDLTRDEWTVKILPALKRIPVADLLRVCGISRSALFEILSGRSRPHPGNRERLKEIVSDLGLM
jgi:hypothetical protein